MTIPGMPSTGTHCNWRPRAPLKKLNGNHFVLVPKDRYNKLNWAVPIFKTTESPITSLFMDNWASPYGIPGKVLTDTELSLLIGSLSHFAPS